MTIVVKKYQQAQMIYLDIYKLYKLSNFYLMHQVFDHWLNSAEYPCSVFHTFHMLASLLSPFGQSWNKPSNFSVIFLIFADLSLSIFQYVDTLNSAIVLFFPFIVRLALTSIFWSDIFSHPGEDSFRFPNLPWECEVWTFDCFSDDKLEIFLFFSVGPLAWRIVFPFSNLMSLSKTTDGGLLLGLFYFDRPL